MLLLRGLPPRSIRTVEESSPFIGESATEAGADAGVLPVRRRGAKDASPPRSSGHTHAPPRRRVEVKPLRCIPVVVSFKKVDASKPVTVEDENRFLLQRNAQLCGFIGAANLCVPDYLLRIDSLADEDAADKDADSDVDGGDDNSAPPPRTDRRKRDREQKKVRAERVRQARAFEVEMKRHHEFVNDSQKAIAAATAGKSLTQPVSSSSVLIYTNSPFLGRDPSKRLSEDAKRLAVGLMKFGFPATIIGRVLGKSDTGVRKWQDDEALQGLCQRDAAQASPRGD